MTFDPSRPALGYPPPAPPTPLRPPNGLPPVAWYPERSRPGSTATATVPLEAPSYPWTASPYDTVPQHPGLLVCQVCQGPNARRVKFLRITGLVLLFRWRSTEVVACQDCGLAVGREQQSKTLLWGWFGVFAFVLNLYAVLRNTVSLARVHRLPASGTGRLPPLYPGRPVFLRAGAVMVVALVGFAGFQTATYEPAATWKVGACVAFADSGTQVRPVSCSARHDGVVVGHASSRATCPASADGSVPDDTNGGVYCVNESV
jgi:hypothetical protein